MMVGEGEAYRFVIIHIKLTHTSFSVLFVI